MYLENVYLELEISGYSTEPSRTKHSRCPQFTVIMLSALLGSQPEIKLRASFHSHDPVKAALEGGENPTETLLCFYLLLHHWCPSHSEKH